jgi:hypothetical protein
MSPTRAANRVGVAMLDQSPFDADTGALPLALLAVRGGAPLWVDAVAGRYLAEPDNRYRTFLARSVVAWNDWAARRAAAQRALEAARVAALGRAPLAARRRVAAPVDVASSVRVPVRDRLGLLPGLGQAGGTLATRVDLLASVPSDLLAGDLVGSALPSGPPRLADALELDYLPAAGPFGQALLLAPSSASPSLAFAPGDLQIELLPVPASTVQDVIEAELPRGTVDLVHQRGDRIRLLLAIPDLDFRRDLLDLPSRDLKLEDELFARYNAAHTSWASWRTRWQAIYGGLTADALTKNQAPALVAPPATPDAVRNRLVETRSAALTTGESLPEPYASHLGDPHGGTLAEVRPDVLTTGLLAQQAALQAEIDQLEADLATSYGLINEVSDYLGLQRQHLDSLTVSFSALAGGVAGDGSGMNLTRWATTATLLPKAPPA